MIFHIKHQIDCAILEKCFGNVFFVILLKAPISSEEVQDKIYILSLNGIDVSLYECLNTIVSFS